ncbi:high nitrogen upregulated cytochrome P450 monooxygenase 2 [Gloeopeniophorella convolvens]|nr:high nitrogen upregulated cytochrome P450 monooxygenase 2 [Gloeopeniophorella convolvens]
MTSLLIPPSVRSLSASFAAYLYFKRFEPYKPLTLFSLLILPPLVLSPPLSSSLTSNFSAFLSSLVAHNALIILYTTAYRLSPWHPLAQYPGPILARLSKFYFAAICAGGKQHLRYRELHERYGNYVRVGPNELSIRDAAAISPVLGAGGLQKGSFWDHRLPSLIGCRDPVEHAIRRRPWSRAFSSTALKEYEVIIAKRLRQLVDSIENDIQRQQREKGRSLIDINKWLESFTTDFMGDMAFGGGFELMEDGGDVKGLWRIFESGFRSSTVFAHVSWILPLAKLIPGMMNNIIRMQVFAAENVIKRLKMGANRRDLFHYLSGEDDPSEERPAMPSVAANGILAIVAGSDTTSTVLAALFYELVRCPWAYQRLKEEVFREFPPGEEPLDASRLSQMKWLNACIDEAMRLYPPVPSGSHRAVLPGAGPIVLGERVIPEGTKLFLNTHSIQRDPHNFSMPDAFLPQRWLTSRLEKDGPSITTHNPTAFFPFSYGPTSCVGKNLALLEMRITVVTIVQHFDFKPGQGYDMNEWESSLKDLFVVQKGPLVVEAAVIRA